MRRATNDSMDAIRTAFKQKFNLIINPFLGASARDDDAQFRTYCLKAAVLWHLSNPQRNLEFQERFNTLKHTHATDNRDYEVHKRLASRICEIARPRGLPISNVFDRPYVGNIFYSATRSNLR